MNEGIWMWPADSRAQQRTLRKVSRSEYLVNAMQAIAKSKDGLSNAELDDTLSDDSNWMTRWLVDQLVSLGFAEYKVDLFGGPGKYDLTDLGRDALSAITGQPVKPRAPPAPTPAAAKPPTPPPPTVPQAKPVATPGK